ncbi:MAG: YncE family protein [Opitutaceae bacterium]
MTARFLSFAAFAALGCALFQPLRVRAADMAAPYRVLRSDKVGGAGGWDYVYADAIHRRLYIPRSNRVTVFDLDTLARVGTIEDTPSVHGVAVDPWSDHAFCSGQPVVMWDARSLVPLRRIEVAGSPDGILFEPFTRRVYVLSHRAPNVTVIDPKNGAVVGTIDLGGAPEEAASDMRGRVYIDLENRNQVAVVDARTLSVTAKYSLDGKGGGPGGLAMDVRHRILFVCCRDPHTEVIMNADDGSIIDTLPIGAGVDSTDFNPQTGECFSSQRDGTLTIVKEDGPRRFHIEQTVMTRPGARTMAFDIESGRIFLVTAGIMPPTATEEAGARANRRRLRMVPGSFTILEVGR